MKPFLETEMRETQAWRLWLYLTLVLDQETNWKTNISRLFCQYYLPITIFINGPLFESPLWFRGDHYNFFVNTSEIMCTMIKNLSNKQCVLKLCSDNQTLILRKRIIRGLEIADESSYIELSRNCWYSQFWEASEYLTCFSTKDWT